MQASSELAAALGACRRAFLAIGLFSGMSNILMLTGSLFMLEVYDRVLPSRSVPTLVALLILTAGLYAAQGFIDAIRSRILVRIGDSLDETMSMRVYDAIVRLPLKIGGEGDGSQPIRDLDSVRGFLSGAGPIDEARGLQAAFEFRGKTAALEHLKHWGNLEGFFHGLGNCRADRLRLARALDLDQHAQVFQVGLGLGFQDGLKIEHVRIAEHHVFEFRVIDVDAAHFEKSGGTVGMPDHRKKLRETAAAGRARHATDQIAGIPT
jgi:hypothetical protein